MVTNAYTITAMSGGWKETSWNSELTLHIKSCRRLCMWDYIAEAEPRSVPECNTSPYTGARSWMFSSLGSGTATPLFRSDLPPSMVNKGLRPEARISDSGVRSSMPRIKSVCSVFLVLCAAHQRASTAKAPCKANCLFLTLHRN